MGFKEFFKPYCLTGIDRKHEYGRYLAGNLMAGGLSGCATFCFIYPLDFTRTRLAVDMGRGKLILPLFFPKYLKGCTYFFHVLFNF